MFHYVYPSNKKKHFIQLFFKSKIESSLLAHTCCIALHIKMLTASQPMFKTFDTGLRANLNDHIYELNWVLTIKSEPFVIVLMIIIRLNSLKNLQSKFSNVVCITARYQQFKQHWRNPFLSLGLHTLDLARLVLFQRYHNSNQWLKNIWCYYIYQIDPSMYSSKYKVHSTYRTDEY